MEPWLNNGELDWREGATAPLDEQVIATFDKPFSRHGGTKVLSGNLGRAVMKTSAVPVENQIIEAPAVVFESQHDVLPALKRAAGQRLRGGGASSGAKSERHARIT
jgi:phosphogluconate dehydratase